ncbi:MAG: polymerase alpha subunit [Pseudomonadota bacterium]
MANQFVHLHLHTQYSLLDGANKIPDVLEQAHKMGQPAIAMTDHGNLHGAIEFYTEAKKIGIKPIIGCELYVTPTSRFERKTKAQGGGGTHHITVLAKDMEGYHNLCRLSSLAFKEGFYFKPRVDHELLERYSKGLIVMSGCLNGELSWALKYDDLTAARKVIEFYALNFKDRFYLEVQPHPIPEQQKLNQGCIEFAKSMGIPLVATTDCHYSGKDDHYAQEVLMCVSTGKQVTDPDRLRHEGVDLHLKSYDEMRAEFGSAAYADEALKNALVIGEQCSVNFEFKTHYMPQFKSDGRPLIEMMAERAREGLKQRLEIIAEQTPDWGPAKKKIYDERLEEEIRLIDKMGFAGYFLVVSDFIVWAKTNGVPVGPGRGSAAGSLVAYAMRITDIEPIANKLLFERFLNPERVSLPDIDVDFCINGRDRVVKYVVEKYGKDNVAQIATFGTLKAKAAIKDVGRALGLSYAETDKVAQLVPAPRQGFDFSLPEALKMEPRLAEYAENEGKELIGLAQKLEGLTRHTSTHAAGVVIGDRPLVDLLPMMVDKDGNDVTQYSMTYVEKIGLVKFDFLGLKTLTVIYTALKIIKESRGIDLNLETLPLADPKTYSILCAGNTTGVFQLESSGITEMTMRLKPNCFDDLVAILALYRPGPLDAGMVDHYIERKHGRQPVQYLHPLMKTSLSDTYGIILYQEQIMQLARELAGYSLAEADLLRKAMGKKIPEEMAKQHDRFVQGAVERKIDKKLAEEIFSQMETFARYGFNRSHSAAYALVSFQTAYLKAHYGVEFMAALMSLEMGDSDKTLKNLNECRKQGIAVLPPDVNVSLAGFSVHDGKIRYGLEAVKGIGEKAVLAAIAARERGPFKDLEDFLTRVDLHAMNRRVLESLIKCGAFDFAGFSRRELIERLDDALAAAQSLQREKDTNQISLFGASSAVAAVPRRSTNRPEWPVNQKLAFEREALGFYISGHPLEKFKLEIRKLGAISVADVRAKTHQAQARVAGVVTALKLKNTKKGDRYATFTLEDYSGTVETIVWPDTYKNVAHILAGDDPVIVGGKIDVTEERCTLITDKIESLTALRDRNATQGLLVLKENDDYEDRLDALLGIFRKHAGSCPVKVRIEVEGLEVSLMLQDKRDAPVSVVPSEALCDEVEQIFGRPVLSFM